MNNWLKLGIVIFIMSIISFCIGGKGCLWWRDKDDDDVVTSSSGDLTPTLISTFMAGSTPFRFIGGFVPGWHWGSEYWSETVDDDLIQTAKAKGITVLHLMLPQFEKSLGVYQEIELIKLDHFLASAANKGVYVMISFIHAYAIALDTGDPYYHPQGIEGLMENATLAQAFKDRMEVLITRQNTINSKVYSADPTILAWIICDEPISAPWNYPGGPPDVTVAELNNWFEEMAVYIKGLDTNHLVTMFTSPAITTLADDDWLKALDVPSLDFIYAEDADMSILNYFYPDSADNYSLRLFSLQQPVVIMHSFTSGTWDRPAMGKDYPWQAQRIDEIFQSYFAVGTNGIIIFAWGTNLYSTLPAFDKCFNYNSANEPICQMFQSTVTELNLSNYAVTPLQFVTINLAPAWPPVSNPTPNWNSANAITADADYLYIVGQEHSPDKSQWRIEKRDKATSQLVGDFGTAGVVITNPSMWYDEATSIAVDADAIYIVGRALDKWYIEKRNKITGQLVNGFGTNGVVTSDPSGGDDRIYAITSDDNYLYIAGDDYALGNCQWRIEKRDKITGQLINDFGGIDSPGVITSNPSAWDDKAYCISADSDYLYIAGIDDSAGPANYQWRIEKRYKISGILVINFGLDVAGVVTSNPSSEWDILSSIAADADYLYVVGYDYSPSLYDSQWRIEKRHKITGTLVSGFGVDVAGVITSNPTSGWDNVSSIVTDADYFYIAGCDYAPNNYQWRVEKRAKTTGELINGFGTNGVMTSNPSIGTDKSNAITADATYIYITGYDSISGVHNAQWRIEKRDKTTGE